MKFTIADREARVPAELRLRNGVSFVVCIGRWGGFAAWWSNVSGLHICLGWLAIALYTFDIDVAIGEAFAHDRKQREATAP